MNIRAACQFCGRPLSARLPRCPYCGERLPGAGARALAPVAAAMAVAAATAIFAATHAPEFRDAAISLLNSRGGAAALSAAALAAFATPAGPRPGAAAVRRRAGFAAALAIRTLAFLLVASAMAAAVAYFTEAWR